MNLNGAENRARTYDLRVTSALLYQLSYFGLNTSILMYPNYTIKCKRKQPNIKYFLLGLEYSKILLLYRFQL